MEGIGNNLETASSIIFTNGKLALKYLAKLHTQEILFEKTLFSDFVLELQPYIRDRKTVEYYVNLIYQVATSMTNFQVEARINEVFVSPVHGRQKLLALNWLEDDALIPFALHPEFEGKTAQQIINYVYG